MEFGSAKALDVWLDSVIVAEQPPVRFPPIDVDQGELTWDRIRLRDVERDFPMAERLEVFVCDRVAGSFCESAPSPFSMTPPDLSRPKVASLALLWAQVSLRPLAPSAIETPTLSVCSTSTLSTSDSHCCSDSGQLRLEPPVRSSPGTSCTECGDSLLSGKSLLNPPGFCEYSGQFICGACFEGRPVVLPYRLVRNALPVRGRVAKRYAKKISQLFYSPSISLASILVPEVRTVHALRVRVFQGRPLIRLCAEAAAAAAPFQASLPAHIREETSFEETLVYSLADIVDIRVPPSGSSRIQAALAQVVTLLDMHACSSCEAVFARDCLVCERRVRTVDPEWRFCETCEGSFHEKCRNWCLDKCPGCANSNLFHS